MTNGQKNEHLIQMNDDIIPLISKQIDDPNRLEDFMNKYLKQEIGQEEWEKKRHLYNFSSLKTFGCFVLPTIKAQSIPNDLFRECCNLIRLDFSNNELTYLSKNLFNECQHLSEVNFSKNYLTNLPDDLFKFNKHLTFIDFSSNKLTNISFKLFNECKNLAEIHFENNKLTVIPKETFISCKLLKHVHFSSNQLTTLSNDLFKRNDQLKEVNFSNNQLNNIPFDLFKSSRYLEEVNFENNHVTNLSHDLFKGCSKLYKICFSENKLTSISLNNLASDCLDLKYIDLSHNLLTFLPENLFTNFKKLERVNFKRNQLGNLPNELFKDSRQMKSIDFSHNQLTHLSNSLFRNCEQLKSADLSHNQLNNLPSDLFRTCHQLAELNLTGNFLIADPSFILLKECKELKRLFVSCNQLTSIQADLFIDGNKLIELNLSSNQLTQLPKNLFSDCHQLKNLNCSDNLLTHLSLDLFKESNKLEKIYFAKNQLTNLPNYLLKNCHQIVLVDFSHNNLANLPKDLFNECKLLKHVHFSANQLVNLSAQLFSQSKQLERAYFSNNKLTNLSNDLFKECTQLWHVDISNNHLINLPRDLFKECLQLTWIDFSNNYLKNLPFDFFKQCYQTLSYAYFSHNRLSHLPNNLFKDCRNLRDVNFSHNHLATLSPHLFRDCEYLIVDFRHNIDMNNLDEFFKLFFRNTRPSLVSSDYESLKTHEIEWNESNFYLMANNDDVKANFMIDKLFLLILNKKCCRIADLLDETNSLMKSLKMVKDLKFSILDFLVSIEDFTSDFILSLKNYVLNLLKENSNIINFEFKFKSSETILTLFKRNDNFLFDTFFPFASFKSLADSIEDDEENNSNFKLISDKFIFRKYFKQFYLQINYSKCFEMALRNNNERMAIHLLLIMKIIIKKMSQPLEQIIQNNATIKEFNEQFLKEYLKEIFKKNWTQLIKFILDTNQNNLHYLSLKWGSLKGEEEKWVEYQKERDMLYHLYILRDKNLLKHQVTRDLLHERWRPVKCFYYLNLIFYIIFLLFYSFNIEVYNNQKLIKNSNKLEISSRLISFILLIYFILIEVFQIILSFKRDLFNYFLSFKNLIELINYPLCIASLWILSNNYGSFQLKSSFYSSSIVLSYFILLFKLDMFMTMGPYVRAFGRILKKSLKLLAILFICLIAFLLAFRNRAQMFTSDDSIDNLMTLFNTSFSASFVTLTTMAVGSLGADQLGIDHITHQNIINLILYILFIFMMPILFLNIFTGISIDEVGRVIENAEVESLLIKMFHVFKFEAIVNGVKLIKLIFRFLIKIISKRSKCNGAGAIIRRVEIEKMEQEDLVKHISSLNDKLSQVLLKLEHIDNKINYQSNEMNRRQGDEMHKLFVELKEALDFKG